MTNTQPVVTRDDIQELKSMISGVGADVLAIKLSNAEHKHYFDKIDALDETVNGVGGKGGPKTLSDHETRISSLESNRRWLIGLITATLLGTIMLIIGLWLK
jgi:hypothetical protein